MKRKQSTSAAAAAAELDADEPSQALLPLDDYSGDVCAALTARYGRSTSAQHRHLLATAAAIGSILADDGQTLTAESYLPAVVSVLRAAGPSDPVSALASLLVILIPHISSLPPAAASESASSVAAFLASPDASKLPTGTVRSVVKSLGHLALLLDPAADWGAVAAPLEALLAASVDQRAKVRRCAQESVEKLFAYLERSGCAKKASSAAIDLFEKHISSVRSLAKLDSDASEAKETEAVHMLGAVAVLVPYLSKKARNTVFSGARRLLSSRFSPLTRHVLRLMDVLLENLKVESIESELEIFISLVLSYLPYDEKKPDDTIIAALQLMRSCLAKLSGHSKLWTKALPSAFEAVSGYLILDRKCSEDIAKLLIECIYSHVDQSILLTDESQPDAEDSSDGAAIKSICLSINKRLRKCPSPPLPDNVLTIVLALFLKLGESSYIYMKDILLTLSRLGMKIHKEPHLRKVEECIGAAIVAMGPDKIHSLLPISFDEDWFTCSNTWLIPILSKYVYGASLQHFIEYIVPLAKSLRDASSRAKKPRKCKELQAWSDQLWNLLPAFCRYPSDVYQNFGSLSKLLVEMLKCDRCLYKSACKGLQQLIDGTRRLSSSDQDVEIPAEISALFAPEANNLSCVSLQKSSKKDARKSMKVLASHSVDLLCTFADDFLDSSEKRAHLKDALRSLAQLSGSANICNLFLSLVKRYGLEDTPLEPENIECQTNEKGEEISDATTEINNKRSLLMELIFTLAEAADEDALDLFFGFIKSSLLNNSKSCDSKALFALSIILKEHHGYALTQLDEIMMLLHGIKPDSNNAVLEGQLVCYKYLLVHMIKVNEESTSKKAFLILNELILALKSKKENRRIAYDVLLAISTSLRSSESNNGDSDLQRLFTMVMGYLSSPSPHIVSGAIAALSLLIYNDANFCMEVPNLIPSVLVLLQNKAIEIIKASLGFVKVLVTSLHPEKLLSLQADIMTGILPWSSFTKHHFKGKVVLILEILIRKCGFDAVNLVTPEKYKEFVRSVEEGRKSNHNPADGAEPEAKDPEHHAPKRRKWGESNAEPGQEEKPKKEFFVKGARKPQFLGARGQQHDKASGDKGDRTHFGSRSKAQSGDRQSYRGGKSPGRDTRPRNGVFNRTQNRGTRPSAHSPRFKKPRTAAAS